MSVRGTGKRTTLAGMHFSASPKGRRPVQVFWRLSVAMTLRLPSESAEGRRAGTQVNLS